MRGRILLGAAGGYVRGPRHWRTRRARELRASDTSAEARLWIELRNRRLGGHKFVRQAPVGPYFVDFLCREHRVYVEVDGGTHSTEAELARDRRREAELRALGLRGIRIRNADVYDNLDSVLDEVLAFIESCT